jgi:hypothetical protein
MTPQRWAHLLDRVSRPAARGARLLAAATRWRRDMDPPVLQGHVRVGIDRKELHPDD